MVSEPRRVPRSPLWFESEDGLAAIFWTNARPGDSCRLVYKARKFVAVKFNNYYIISCYLSPNIDRAEVQDSLDELRNLITKLSQRTIIGGDFNRKSILWGYNSFTCSRGRLLEEWSAELDLCLLNEGTSPTCIRPQGHSIVDVTWCTPDLRREISGWKVREDMETLSDHQYIEMVVGRNDGRNLSSQPVDPVAPPRWTRGEWDTDSFKAVAHWEMDQLTILGDDMGIEILTRRVMKIIQDSYDAATERIKPRHGSKQVYWWNSSIVQSRKLAIRARRAWSKAKVKYRDSELVRELHGEYKEAKKVLRKEINKAKAEAWQKLVKDLDNDPWGLAYKVVLGRLRPTGPALTEILEDQVLKRTLSQLFPQNENGDNRERDLEAIPDTISETDSIISVSEVTRVIKEKRGRNTAPGRDGIPLRAIGYLPEEGHQVLASLFSRCMKEGKFPLE